MKTEDKHHLMQTDDFEKCIIESTWFTKQFPRRRVSRNAPDVPEKLISLNTCRDTIFKIERTYSEAMDGAEREWDTQENRKQFLENLDSLEQLQDLYSQVHVLEKGFNDPWQKTTKENDQGEMETKRRKI